VRTGRENIRRELTLAVPRTSNNRGCRVPRADDTAQQHHHPRAGRLARPLPGSAVVCPEVTTSEHAPRTSNPRHAGLPEIGAPGFKPGTSCSQSTMAIRLRRHHLQDYPARRAQGLVARCRRFTCGFGPIWPHVRDLVAGRTNRAPACSVASLAGRLPPRIDTHNRLDAVSLAAPNR
jgi:hypothetical protein